MTPNNVTSIQGPAVEDGMKVVFRLSGCVQTGKMGRKRSPTSVPGWAGWGWFQLVESLFKSQTGEMDKRIEDSPHRLQKKKSLLLRCFRPCFCRYAMLPFYHLQVGT
jgi:hypothetical protein